MAARDYRTMQAELDELLAWFESEEVDLDLATKKYEQATKLIEAMEKYLETASNKVSEINDVV